ncbi:hypothetical protein C9417_15560 [Rhizobium sp. SEMIA 4088]|nr:hypothetical protein C9417_15560 [Rhizobium sp. SEMIA 4088]
MSLPNKKTCSTVKVAVGETSIRADLATEEPPSAENAVSACRQAAFPVARTYRRADFSIKSQAIPVYSHTKVWLLATMLHKFF